MTGRDSAARIRALTQTWPAPSAKRPIVIIGAGSIITDAHLPAYARGGYPVQGIFDINREQAQRVAAAHAIPTVYSSLEQALSADAVLDIAVPPAHLLEVVRQLPGNAVTVLQKPLGANIDEAREICRVVKDRAITAKVNFQLRFSPMMLALRDAVAQGMLGRITDLDLHLSARQPWECWPYMEALEAMEVVMHSIHYMDWMRSLLGEPVGVYSKSVAHPDYPRLADARASTILEFDAPVRCSLAMNHTYKHGPGHQDASVRVDGEKGCAWLKLGLLLNYPEGEPDEMEISTEGSDGFVAVPLQGGWFPDGFIGVMANLQRYAAGEDEVLVSSCDDAFNTMALVDACIRSSRNGATPVMRE